MNKPDIQILKLIEILKGSGVIRFDKDFCDAIDLRKQNLVNIKAGRNHFTPEHIEKAVKQYHVNANWIFGVSEKIFLNPKTLRPLENKEFHDY
jgi:hypothetical protein